MRFEDFVLQFDTSSRGGFRARVLKSPSGEGTVGFSLPALAGEEPAGLDVPGISRDLGHQNTAPTLGGRPPLEIGAELFRSVFQGQVRTLLDKSRGQIEKSPGVGLRLKIKLDPGDEETGALADLPWELLCDETEDFFALSRQTSLVRYLDVPRPSQPIPFTPPLRILAIGASPYGLQPLDLEEEMRRLEELNRSSAGVEVKTLAHASAGAVREALAGDTYNVLHFMGHGTFDRASGEGMLAFEGANGSLDLVSGKAFATKLRDLRSLGVVVLNACNTARARQQGGANPFRGVATALVLGGVPAVVAMQRPISDRAAIGFSTAFYRHLARGDSIDEALTEGRQAIHSAKPDDFEWATPVLFLRVPEGNVFVAKPVVSGRGPALKIAVGAAGTVGAGLVTFFLYTRAHAPTINPIPRADTMTSQAQPSLTSDLPSGSTKPPALVSERAKTVQPARETEQRLLPGLKPGGSSAQEPAPQKSSPPVPAPAGPAASSTVEVPTPAADLSKLSARLVSITERDGGGLRVTVSFKNNSDRPMSILLDTGGSMLSNDQGLSDTIVGSSLPGESSLRLALAPGASSSPTFDFPAPKLHSKTFTLALATADGQNVRIADAQKTLEGAP